MRIVMGDSRVGYVLFGIFHMPFLLHVDQRYEKYAGEAEIETPEAVEQTQNCMAETATGTDLIAWVDSSDLSHVSYSLVFAAAYRTAGASKAVPSFDGIGCGEELCVSGNSTRDARHWDSTLLEIFQEYADVLEPLFNAG